MDTVELNDLQLSCVIGVLEREQRETQRVVVHIRLSLPLEHSGDTGDLGASVNYARVASQLQMLADHGRFRLIESLGLAACRLLLAPPLAGEGRAQIHTVAIEIRKPEVMAPLTTPGIRMARTAPLPLQSKKLGNGVNAETLVDLPQGGAWRITLDDGTTWDPPGDIALEVICGQVTCGGQTVQVGGRLARGAGAVKAAGPAGLLAVGRLF